MACSDLAITKPGGLTTSECLAMGVPMLLNAPIPRQEESNADYLLEHGAALKAVDTVALEYRVAMLLAEPESCSACTRLPPHWGARMRRARCCEALQMCWMRPPCPLAGIDMKGVAPSVCTNAHRPSRHPLVVTLTIAWTLLLAYFFANVEIQIEGAAGWAADLPTWRIERHWLLDLFWGGRAMTGYHAWVFPCVALFFHFPLVFGAAIGPGVRRRGWSPASCCSGSPRISSGLC